MRDPHWLGISATQIDCLSPALINHGHVEESMRARLLLVGDDSVLLHSREELLQDLAQIRLARSSDAEASIVAGSYELVVLCQTVPEHLVRRLLKMTWMLDPSPDVMVIDGSEEHRRLGAVTYRRQLCNPSWLKSVVAALIASSSTDYGFVVRIRSPKQILHYVVASTAEIQGEHLIFVNSKGKLIASFMLDAVCSWNVLSQV
jgi:hypothetical protein